MITKDDFMCVCSDESREIVAECLDRVYKDLDCGPHDVVSKVIYALNWSLGNQDKFIYGMIEGIPCDQWCAVASTVKIYEDNEPKDLAHIYVQCDVVEHGIARTWELAKEAVKESLSEDTTA
jgi:hypothetical protein